MGQFSKSSQTQFSKKVPKQKDETEQRIRDGARCRWCVFLWEKVCVHLRVVHTDASCAFSLLLYVSMHLSADLCDARALRMLSACLFSDVCAHASTQPKAELTDSFPLRSPLVFLIDRHNAKVQALSLVPMLIAGSCIFMSSLGINQLNKGWGRWLGAVFITDSDWLERKEIRL